MSSDDEIDAEPDDSLEESEKEEQDESEKEYKYDVVILHNDDQTGLARVLRDQLRDIQLDNGRQLRVEILDDVMRYGAQVIAVFDDVIEHATFLLFFREVRFFEEELHGFAVGAAFYDRVCHKDPKQRETLWAVDVGKKTLIKGKAFINSLFGVTVTDGGILNPEALDKIRERLRSLSANSQIVQRRCHQRDVSCAAQVSNHASSSHGNERYDARTGTPLLSAGPCSHSQSPPASSSSSFPVPHAAAAPSSPLPQSVEIDAPSPQEDRQQYQQQQSGQRHQQQQSNQRNMQQQSDQRHQQQHSIQLELLKQTWNTQGARPKMTNSAERASSDQTDTSPPPTVPASTACPADGDTYNTMSQRHHSGRLAGPASLPQQSQDAIDYHHLQESREGTGHAQSRQSIQSTDVSENTDSDRTEVKTLATETESTSSTADFVANNEHRDADREQRRSMGERQSSDPELGLHSALVDMLRQTSLTPPPASLVEDCPGNSGPFEESCVDVDMADGTTMAYREVRSVDRYHSAPTSACPTEGDNSVAHENPEDY